MPAANGSLRQRHPPPKGNLPEALSDGNTLAGKNDAAIKSDQEAQPQANTFRLVICVGGIYLSLYVCISFFGFITQYTHAFHQSGHVTTFRYSARSSS